MAVPQPGLGAVLGRLLGEGRQLVADYAELTVLDATRRPGQRAERPRERAGENPREPEPQRERDQPHPHDDEHVLSHAAAHGLHALRDPDRASTGDRPPRVF